MRVHALACAVNDPEHDRERAEAPGQGLVHPGRLVADDLLLLDLRVHVERDQLGVQRPEHRRVVCGEPFEVARLAVLAELQLGPAGRPALGVKGTAIRKVCARFVALCRTMGLLTQASVAIDGSKFKAVNNRDKNFTRAKMERRMRQIEESVARYLQQIDSADRQEPSEALKTKTSRLKEKIEKLKEQMRRLEDLKVQMLATPDQQISLTDPDSRSMATSGRGSGVVGYNVQVAVDTKHHLIITHEVTNIGTDRSQLAHVANEAKAALDVEKLDAVADRGYFNSEEILACEEAGITVHCQSR